MGSFDIDVFGAVKNVSVKKYGGTIFSIVHYSVEPMNTSQFDMMEGFRAAGFCLKSLIACPMNIGLSLMMLEFAKDMLPFVCFCVSRTKDSFTLTADERKASSAMMHKNADELHQESDARGVFDSSFTLVELDGREVVAKKVHELLDLKWEPVEMHDVPRMQEKVQNVLDVRDIKD